jgi:hypothetical protein
MITRRGHTSRFPERESLPRTLNRAFFYLKEAIRNP